jgi:hypothetical protein
MQGGIFLQDASVITPDVVADYLAANIHTRAEVLARPRPVPREPGVYRWWFDELPHEDITIAGCKTRDGLILLYAGISPKEPPKNGRPPSRETLRSRIRTHYKGNAAGSTLRLTLGCLLAERLQIELRRYGSGKPRRPGAVQTNNALRYAATGRCDCLLSWRG